MDERTEAALKAVPRDLATVARIMLYFIPMEMESLRDDIMRIQRDVPYVAPEDRPRKWVELSEVIADAIEVPEAPNDFLSWERNVLAILSESHVTAVKAEAAREFSKA